MGGNLKDIASELGLSIATVSRVINNKDNVSTATRRKVLNAIKKHNYMPNQVARSLRTHSTKTIGIIVPDIREYFTRVIRGADEVLSAAGYFIILADSHENEATEQQYLKLLYEKQIDGLLLATVSDDTTWINHYLENGIPTVFFDNMPKVQHGVNTVLLDNERASEMAVKHLKSEGHKKIAIICGNQNETTAKERAEGFLKAVKENKLKIDPALIQYSSYKVEAGYQCMTQLLKQRKEHPFTAVYTTSYKMTCEAIHAIKNFGLRYPEDISLIGFDMNDEDSLYSPSITSLIQPARKIGQVLGTRLLDLINIAAKSENQRYDLSISQHSTLEPELKVGKSSILVEQ